MADDPSSQHSAPRKGPGSGGSSPPGKLKESPQSAEVDRNEATISSEAGQGRRPAPAGIASQREGGRDTTSGGTSKRRSDGRNFVAKGTLTEAELVEAKRRAQSSKKRRQDMTEAEIKEERRASNRLASFQSRQRRKESIQNLEDKVTELSRQNEEQKAEGYAILARLKFASRENELLRRELAAANAEIEQRVNSARTSTALAGGTELASAPPTFGSGNLFLSAAGAAAAGQHQRVPQQQTLARAPPGPAVTAGIAAPPASAPAAAASAGHASPPSRPTAAGYASPAGEAVAGHAALPPVSGGTTTAGGLTSNDLHRLLQERLRLLERLRGLGSRSPPSKG